MEPSTEKIGDRLKERRIARALSIYEVAKRAGVKWHTIADIEKGLRKPQVGTLRKLERALNG